MGFDITLCDNGHAMAAEDPACDLCGAPRQDPGEGGVEQEDGVVCPSGHANSADAPFCEACGVDLRALARCLNGHRAPAAATSCSICGAMVIRQAEPLGAKAVPLDAPLDLVLGECSVLGGSGVGLHRGEGCALHFTATNLAILGTGSGFTLNVPYGELRLLALSGGEVTTGGGFIGGGFGLEGAVKGIALASVANWLTTRTTVHTLIQVAHRDFEVFLHHGEFTSAELRIRLSSAFQQLPSMG